MPVTFTVANHKAEPVVFKETASSPQDLLEKSWGHFNKDAKCVELLQSSMGSGRAQAVLNNTRHQNNGFVHTVITAYNQHHRLIIRPDDVWMAILTQFNFYVNAHAEELRSSFVAHEGKKELRVTAFGNRYSVDFGDLANQMSDQIEQNVVDKDLKSWILPDFTTTTHNDTVICSVLMMATLKAYFRYTVDILCGIPEVTLEGEKADYEKILARLDKLASFGPEPEFWAKMLRSILSRFVSSFDGEPDLDFWGRICNSDYGSGSASISGWLTAFCVWSEKGKWMGPEIQLECPLPSDSDETSSFINYYEPKIDGIEYRRIDCSRIPVGFCEVDVKVNDNAEELDCMMVAGHVASAIEGTSSDTLRPAPAWFMFVKE